MVEFNETLGRYVVTDNEDGTKDIAGVPIFKLGLKRKGRVYDDAWASSAIKAHNDIKAEDGYVPPVFKGHTKDDEEEKPATGAFDNLRIESKKILADLVRIPSKVYSELKEGMWPSRSIEAVNTEGDKRILGLALLGASTPACKFKPLSFQQFDGNPEDVDIIEYDTDVFALTYDDINRELRDAVREKYPSKDNEMGAWIKTLYIDEPRLVVEYDGKLLMMGYGRDENSDVVLGEAQEVKEAYVPVAVEFSEFISDIDLAYESAEPIDDKDVFAEEKVNFHSARVKSPGLFQKGSFRTKKIGGSGVTAIIGRLKGKTTTTVQAYRFPISKFTVAKANAWLKRNNVKAKVTPARKAKAKEDITEVINMTDEEKLAKEKADKEAADLKAKEEADAKEAADLKAKEDLLKSVDDNEKTQMAERIKELEKKQEETDAKIVAAEKAKEEAEVDAFIREHNIAGTLPKSLIQFDGNEEGTALRDMLLNASPETRKTQMDMLKALPKSVQFTESAKTGDEADKEASDSQAGLEKQLNDLTNKYMEDHEGVDIKDAMKIVMEEHPELKKFEENLIG